MSISEKQLKANQKNAQKSTGPKTDEGKKKVAQNAIRHGLYANTLILDAPHFKEDSLKFELMLESLRSDLLPETYTQDLIVQKIAACIWRNKRFIAAETAYVNEQLDRIDDDLISRKIIHKLEGKTKETETAEFENRFINNHVGKNSIPKDKFGIVLQRYEMRLDRQLTRLYRMLRSLKREERLLKKEEQNNGTPKY